MPIELADTAGHTVDSPPLAGAKQPSWHFHARWIGLWLACCPVAWPADFASGGIATDGSLGPAQSLGGDTVTIPQFLGKTLGRNLFHSFTRFDIATGQTVTFTEATPNTLNNVIARVTGGFGSEFDGILRSTPGGHANFYLLNPAGVLFGPNASLDIAGAFHASTADQLRFKDGAVFSASQPQASTLSAEAPAAFGFLGTSPVNNGLLQLDRAHLAAKPGQAMDFVAGGVAIADTADNFASSIKAEQGEIRLTALQGAGEVGVEPTAEGWLPLPDRMPTPATAGDISLQNGAISAFGEDRFRIAVWGSHLTLDHSSLLTSHTGLSTAGGGLVVRSTALWMDHGAIAAFSYASGKGGDMDIESAGPLNMVNQAVIGSYSLGGAGDTGNVRISSASLTLDNANIYTQSFNDHASGSIHVRSGALELRGGATIDASNLGTGHAGDIDITAQNLILDHARLSSGVGENAISPAAKGAGAAGAITLTVANALAIGQDGAITSISRGGGDSGAVAIRAGRIALSAGGAIDASTRGGGKAGSVDIQADSVSLATGAVIRSDADPNSTGDANNVSVQTTGDLTLTREGRISSSTYGQGHAGSVTIKARNLALDGAGALPADYTGCPACILSRAEAGSTGHAGTVRVEVEGGLSIRRGGFISTGTHGYGDGSHLTVQAGRLFIDRQGAVDAQGQPLFTGLGSRAYRPDNGPAGRAGDIKVDVTGNLAIVGGLIRVTSMGAKDAGNIQARAGRLRLAAGGTIDASTWGDGKAGNVGIVADSVSLSGGAAIRSNAVAHSTGNAGSVLLETRGDVRLVNGSEISTSTHAPGQAGRVQVKTHGNLRINGYGTGIFSTAYPGSAGDAGEVEVEAAGSVTVADGGKIDSDTESTGQGGDVSVAGGTIRLARGTISALAGRHSSGRPGDLEITAREALYLADGGKISIENRGRAADPKAIEAGRVAVSAPDITLSGGLITTRSSRNAPAGSIRVSFSGQLCLEQDSAISTVAWDGNGGAITLDGGRLIRVSDSTFTTSVLDRTNGNGGDIAIAADNLILRTGLIQANTEAPAAVGGDITLHIRGLLNSGETLFLGGDQPVAWQPYAFGLNIIQAAASDGVPGGIRSTAPQLHLSSALGTFAKPRFDARVMGEEYCTLGTGSTLTRTGQGGLLPKGGDLQVY